jgi:hypothetical protein
MLAAVSRVVGGRARAVAHLPPLHERVMKFLLVACTASEAVTTTTPSTMPSFAQ